MKELREPIRKKVIASFSKDFDEKKLTEMEKAAWDTYGEKEYKRIIYEAMGALEYILKNNVTEKDIYVGKLIESIRKKEDGWKSRVYENIKIKNREEVLSSLQQESKLEDSPFPCRNKNCKSEKTYFYTLQTRSIDESESIYVICRHCKKRYKMN